MRAEGAKLVALGSLKSVRGIIAALLVAYAGFLFFYSLPQINLIGPLIVIALALWVFGGFKKTWEGRAKARTRIRVFLDVDPYARRLDIWSKRLGWIGWAVSCVVLLYLCSEFIAKGETGWFLVKVTGAIVIAELPSLVLFAIVMGRYYRYGREKQTNIGLNV